MPVSTMPATPVSPGKKDFDYFQRKKVGSIRDNPKLMKIRQRFENASQDEKMQDLRITSSRHPGGSAPSSISHHRRTGSGMLLDELVKMNSLYSDRTETFSKSKLGLPRRHSEGEATSAADRTSLSVFVSKKENGYRNNVSSSESSLTHSGGDSSIKQGLDACRSGNINKNNSASLLHLADDGCSKQRLSNSCRTGGNHDGNSIVLSLLHLDDNSKKMVDSSKTISSSSPFVLVKKQNKKSNRLESDSLAPKTEIKTFHRSMPSIIPKAIKVNNKVQMFEVVDVPAPPIPKRGISPAVKNNMVSALSLSSSQNDIPSSPTAKTSPVKKTIMMYEGMMSSLDATKKSKSFSSRHGSQRTSSFSKKDLSSSGGVRSSALSRRSSRRNSMKKNRNTGSEAKSDEKNTITIECVPKQNDSSTTKEICPNKADSGLGSSEDVDDKIQPVYQTLTTVVRNLDDPYDRLSRLHEAVNRIHKGQISSCAACKTLPPDIVPRWPTDDGESESSLLHVKCHESTPHHHPPCICFSCSHSVFSCSFEEVLPLGEEQKEDTLYSNVCCLNFSLDRGEGWRQSRRRPVCETNGRLCVVNCDMEQQQQRHTAKTLDACYDKLHEWNSSSASIERNTCNFKPMLADSCDSDEGWVDVTDSEDEKNTISLENFPSTEFEKSDTAYRNFDKYMSIQNTSYDIGTLISKCIELDLSRCSSTEHLYETIADVESQNAKEAEESPDGSSTISVKSEQTPENDLDSGEWSTESTSPAFDESTVKVDEQPKVTGMNYQNRFAVQFENQETAKQNFMKSVLGKKTPTTKRRMSNFFVPWLVMNECHTTPSNIRGSHKTVAKKKSGCYPASIKTSPRKTKRSQSIPSSSDSSDRLCDVSLSSPESLDKLKNKSPKSENSNMKFVDTLCVPNDTSSRISVASSAYMRVDELQTHGSIKESHPTSLDISPIEVSVERICKKTSDGSSEHSYILFQPVKEEEVPLYQFYERNVKERVSFCCSPNSLSPVFSTPTTESGNSIESGIKPQISVVEQLSPDTQDMKMLWCELPEVKDSGILERISAQELKLQEAAFEFIQSQASFIRSLKVLYENFIQIPEFSDPESSSCVLSKHEHDVLFSDIIRVKEVGENLLRDLTTRWSDGILIPDICDIIHHHAKLPSFTVYIRYCSNRVYQERTLKELKETRLCFLEVLRKLESNPACQGLSLESFLFLPMQHIARLPLLLDNIFRWLTPESPSYCTCKMALEAVHKVFMECNEGARKMERLEEMFVLNKQLEFKECKALPLISASRWLLKKGELLKLEFDKKTFGRSSRCVRVPVFIFLFNDLLVVTKRKSEDCYLVVDYCSRDKVQAMVANAQDLQPPVVVPNTCRYLIYLTLLHNHQGNTVNMILSCTLLSERTRWIEAIHSVPENKPCEVWEYDCPQVQCVRNYIAQQPDELSLQESDVVTIHRKMNDGWYEGRRLRDGLQGWFPASYTMDIPCSRARASNLRQCYRLLMLSHKQ